MISPFLPISDRGDGSQTVEVMQGEACGEGVAVGEVLGELLVEEGGKTLARLFLGRSRDLDGRDRDQLAGPRDQACPTNREHPIHLLRFHDNLHLRFANGCADCAPGFQALQVKDYSLQY